MKNLTLSTLAVFMFLGFTSCSTDESLESVTLQKENLLKSYKVQRDINGRFSIDVNTSSGTDVETVKNTRSNSNEFYLYSNGITGEQSFNDNLSLDDDRLALDFVENSQTKTSFIIEDQDIVLADGETNTEFLQEYSFDVNNETKTVELDFKVREGVVVSFIYNEELATYEVHLMEGKSNGLSFSKSFSKEDSPIKIDFVNHLNSTSVSESTIASRPKRPRILIGQGEDRV